MAGITGLGTTYNLPNYTGLLFHSPPPTRRSSRRSAA
jgi:hypothetical protein